MGTSLASLAENLSIIDKTNATCYYLSQRLTVMVKTTVELPLKDSNIFVTSKTTTIETIVMTLKKSMDNYKISHYQGYIVIVITLLCFVKYEWCDLLFKNNTVSSFLKLGKQKPFW